MLAGLLSLEAAPPTPCSLPGGSGFLPPPETRSLGLAEAKARMSLGMGLWSEGSPAARGSWRPLGGGQRPGSLQLQFFPGLGVAPPSTTLPPRTQGGSGQSRLSTLDIVLAPRPPCLPRSGTSWCRGLQGQSLAMGI